MVTLQSRADNSYEREAVKLISPDLLIIDDWCRNI